MCLEKPHLYLKKKAKSKNTTKAAAEHSRYKEDQHLTTEHGEQTKMTERTTLSLVTCTSCGKPIPPGTESTKFMCPSCGDIQIKRDGKCRKFGRTYKCPKCGFIGP